MGEKCSDKFRLRIRLPRNSRDLLHAANLRHGTDGFISSPKEGVLKIFSPLKIRRLRPGLNPRTWVPKASTLPLDHRSRLFHICFLNIGVTFLCVQRTFSAVSGRSAEAYNLIGFNAVTNPQQYHTDIYIRHFSIPN